ncbi:hypothetical protein, partial [Pseudodonghicola xiamenensis]
MPGLIGYYILGKQTEARYAHSNYECKEWRQRECKDQAKKTSALPVNPMKCRASARSELCHFSNLTTLIPAHPEADPDSTQRAYSVEKVWLSGGRRADSLAARQVECMAMMGPRQEAQGA